MSMGEIAVRNCSTHGRYTFDMFNGKDICPKCNKERTNKNMKIEKEETQIELLESILTEGILLKPEELSAIKATASKVSSLVKNAKGYKINEKPASKLKKSHDFLINLEKDKTASINGKALFSKLKSMVSDNTYVSVFLSDTKDNVKFGHVTISVTKRSKSNTKDNGAAVYLDNKGKMQNLE